MPETPPLPGWPVEPDYRPLWPAHPPAQQPVVHHHHCPAPAPVRRGPSPSTVLTWVAVGGISVAALLAVALAAVGIGLAAVALAILGLVLRGIWRDITRR